MKKMSETVVFFGSGPVAVKSLIFLKDKFEIEAVITKPATLQEMAQIVPGASSKAVKTKEELTQFISTKPFKSRLGVIVDFGIIVDQTVINYFPLGIINSHFSSYFVSHIDNFGIFFSFITGYYF